MKRSSEGSLRVLDRGEGGLFRARIGPHLLNLGNERRDPGGEAMAVCDQASQAQRVGPQRGGIQVLDEPVVELHRFSWRLFGLSHATIASSSICA